MELTGYLAVARRWWWTLLVATWVAGMAGLAVASTIPSTYEARTQLLVGPFNTDRETLSAAGALVQTYSELVTTAPVLQSALAEVQGANLTVEELEAATRATANDTTRFLTIRVQGTDPEIAARLANALAEEISARASSGTNRLEGQLQVVDIATPPVDPIAPQRSLIVGLAALAALIGAMVLVMLVEYLSAAVRSDDELEKITDLPFLGKVDIGRSLPSSSRALVDSSPDSAAAAAYRLIVAKVAFRADRSTQVRSVVIVGTGPDGTTGQVAANLAAITARGGRQVVLVDADTVGAAVTRIFALDGRPGLMDVVTGSAGPDAAMVQVSSTLRVVPRGTTGDDDTIGVERARSILAALAQQADLVIISTGPLHLSAAALVWSQAADTSVVVAARDQSRRDDVTYAAESLKLVGADLSGTVLAERRRNFGRRVGNQPPERPRPIPREPIESGPAYAADGGAEGLVRSTAEPSRPARARRTSRAGGDAGSSGG